MCDLFTAPYINHFYCFNSKKDKDTFFHNENINKHPLNNFLTLNGLIVNEHIQTCPKNFLLQKIESDDSCL